MKRRNFLKALGAVGFGCLATGWYTWQWEPHWVEFVERPLEFENLPDGLDGARLVQLSDLHIGRQVDDDYLVDTFQRVQALAPEIVVYTGDFISYEGDELKHLSRLFSQLPRGRIATAGVLGNHDYGRGWRQTQVAQGIANLAESSGVRILRNEIAEVLGFQIVGLDDLWARQFQPTKVLPCLDENRPSVVLVHNPDAADRNGWENYTGWLLCGHTHGGQCKPPFLPPPMLPVLNRRYQAGEYQLNNGRRMYINRGVGHLLQVRFNVRPEVTVFTLKQALSRNHRRENFPRAGLRTAVTKNDCGNPGVPRGATG